MKVLFLPDGTENPFGAHNDSSLTNFAAKRLKGAGSKDELRKTKVGRACLNQVFNGL